MNKKRLLVAASPAICSASWLKRNLLNTVSNEHAISLIGNNSTLENILKEENISFDSIKNKSNFSKNEIRKHLLNHDYFLMFWDGNSHTDFVFEARLLKIPSKVIAIQVTEVVNKDRGDYYDIYVGRGTPWGNPFPVGPNEGQYERDEAISRFKEYFESEILGDESKRRGLLGMRGMRIGCHCKPFACHGDVIASYLNSLDPDDLEEKL